MNVNAPNGFQDFGRLDGGSPTEGLTTRLIANADNVPVGYGDPVTSLSTGYVTRSAGGASTAQIDGIFYGCTYLSPAVGRQVWSPNWPGSGATGDITAYIKNDPEAMFVVQATSTALTFANIGENVQITVGTPNAVTGMSTSSVDTPSATATLPFRIVGLLSDYSSPSNSNGTDNTSNFNRVIVTANNWDRKSLTGI